MLPDFQKLNVPQVTRGAYTTSPALDVLPELAAPFFRRVERVAAAAVAVLAAVALLPRLHDPVPARRGRNCRKSTVERYTQVVMHWILENMMLSAHAALLLCRQFFPLCLRFLMTLLMLRRLQSDSSKLDRESPLE